MNKFIITIIAIIVVAGAGTFLLNKCEDDWCFVFEWQKIRAADSFERCAQLGFPIAESYPRQCRAGDKNFIENIVSEKSNLIKVATPLPNSKVTSPLTITGEARGTWYFEASFPIKLIDADGNQLTIIPAQAQSEWMTTEFVPFKAVLNFAKPKTQTGTLILIKDNPSGLPQFDD